MIQLDLDCEAIIGPLDALRAEFAAADIVQLPRFLSPALLAHLQESVASAEFVERVHAGIGRDQNMVANPALSLIHFALNAPALLSAVEEVTGAGRLGRFLGHVFTLTPGTEDHDSWHSDVGSEREVGLTVNLGADPCAGGVFQLKDVQRGLVRGEIANTIAGDAVIFRIADRLRHRATPVTGTVTRITLAGWFHSGPDFQTFLAAAR